ncbi:MAG TPA: ribulokinase [Thermoanaerobaculia bacterium]|nr:ribulokinase [Thermoanaerobaculia bacterium]
MSPTGPSFAIGVDYGTNSVRALVVDTRTGEEVALSIYDYPSGEAGVLLDPRDPHLARQSPADYLEGFRVAVRDAVDRAREHAHFRPERIAGIGVDTTGSTPIPVDRRGRPLAFDPAFRDDLAAQAWLWKDHTSWVEAAEITEAAAARPEGYLSKCGGTYSSEWYWSKILHCARTAPRVFEAADSWVELADFIPAWATGSSDPRTLVRGICAAGHKAMYNERWGGLPSAELLGALDPRLVPLRDRFATPALSADRPAGGLCEEVAVAVGILAGTPVAVGAFDAHMGAVGAGIRPGTLVKILGTSTCDLMVAPDDGSLADVPGLCGQVPGSVLPGLIGLEAGQSAVGDVFDWFVRRIAPHGLDGEDAHRALSREASGLRAGESGLLALDWNNGNRTVLVDPMLTGLLVGQTLHTTPGEIYRALIEATAFGALVIIERLEEHGVAVEEVVTCGGIAEKSPFVLQVYADVCDRPMKVSRSSQTCALGAAVFGAVAGGAHPDVPTAQAAMTGVQERILEPSRDAAATYRELFALYRILHDGFGGVATPGGAELGRVMKDLIDVRERVRREAAPAEARPPGMMTRLVEDPCSKS